MDVLEPFDGLEFNDDFFLDQEIEPVLADLMITIKEWNGLLPNECNSAQGKLYGQRLLVDGLQKAWPKLGMNGNRGGNHLLRDVSIP